MRARPARIRIYAGACVCLNTDTSCFCKYAASPLPSRRARLPLAARAGVVCSRVCGGVIRAPPVRYKAHGIAGGLASLLYSKVFPLPSIFSRVRGRLHFHKIPRPRRNDNGGGLPCGLPPRAFPMRGRVYPRGCISHLQHGRRAVCLTTYQHLQRGIL